MQRVNSLPPRWDDPVLSVAQAQNLLGQAGYVLMQAEEGGHILGVAVAGAVADVVTLFVPPTLRRQGIGAALVAAFIRHAQAAGATGVTLEVRADNMAAIDLYTAAGLAQVARRPAYYPDGTAALVLTKQFG